MCGESSGSKGGCPHGATVAGKVSHILVTPGREGDHPQTRKKRYQDIEVEASMHQKLYKALEDPFRRFHHRHPGSYWNACPFSPLRGAMPKRKAEEPPPVIVAVGVEGQEVILGSEEWGRFTQRGGCRRPTGRLSSFVRRRPLRVKDGMWQRWVWKMVCERWCVKDGMWQRWCVTKLYVKDGMWQRWCVTKLYVKDGMWQRWYVTKMVCDKVVCERWYVTKMVCDKVVCERWYVTKMVCDKVVCERWYVTKMICDRWCVKDGPWQRWCVTGGRREAGGGRRQEGGDPGYRIKNKNPTQSCGENNNGCTGIKQTFTWPKTRFYPGITGQPGQLMYLLVPLATWWSAS